MGGEELCGRSCDGEASLWGIFFGSELPLPVLLDPPRSGRFLDDHPQHDGRCQREREPREDVPAARQISTNSPIP